MPNLTVIVPVYCTEPYISRCIDSILWQTKQDFETVLVDDGSPDQAGELCEAYAQEDSRLHVIHQRNMGLSAARNTGIDWALANDKSNWVSFIDSDDWVHPQYLETLALGNIARIGNVGIRTVRRKDRESAPALDSVIPRITPLNQKKMGRTKTFSEFDQDPNCYE